jgi:4'-phosphopantetheinyl transferase
LLSESEQASVLKYYFVKDAKMSLGSALLKHLIITKYCKVPWSSSTISRKGNGKPCFISKSGDSKIDFNVSHQAGIVSLIAAIGSTEDVQVGTDVVCANERLKSDYAHIEKEGFFDWVDMHADVFAEKEINHMKLSPVMVDFGIPVASIHGYGNDELSRCQWRNRPLYIKIKTESGDEKMARVESNTVVDSKLRRFYAMWCLREAYVKMTGEALLAPWLKDLVIADVEAPVAGKDTNETYSLKEGGTFTNFECFMKGERVTDVKIDLTAFGEAYIVGGAIRLPRAYEETLVFGKWEMLNLERDVLNFAEMAL